MFSPTFQKGKSMKGLIVMNGYPRGEKFYRQSERVKEELERLGIAVELVKNGEFPISLTENAEVVGDLQEYSFCVYFDKDKYLSQMLENAGVRLFNSARAIELCDDKMQTFLDLKNSGLKIPRTISAPLCYTPNAVPKTEFLIRVKELGYPLVAKKSYGSFGMGVKLIENDTELFAAEQEWLHEPHFYQEFIGEKGRDIRVIVIGGKAVAAMERIAQEGEFRSNVELGGKTRKIELPKEYQEAAELAAKTLGLDYCGVDLLKGKTPVVCEVNSNAFFEGIEGVTGVNVARLYAEYIVRAMTK